MSLKFYFAFALSRALHSSLENTLDLFLWDQKDHELKALPSDLT